MAAAWHLVAAHTAAAARAGGGAATTHPPHLTLFDPHGLGAGASAAAGGLLHPFSPAGGPLWEGEAAFAEAAALVAVAQRFCEEEAGSGGGGGSGHGSSGGPVASRGVTMLRPAEGAAQAGEWVRRRAGAGGAGRARAALLTAAQARAALPGVALPSEGEGPGTAAAAATTPTAPTPAAWATTAGLVVHPARYLGALWGATQAAAAAAGGGAVLDADAPPVRSLRALDEGGGDAPPRFAAIVLAAGAGTGCVAEAAPLAARLDLVGGATADWEGAPGWAPGTALLGRFYGAPVPGGGGGDGGGGGPGAPLTVRVGATRDRHVDGGGGAPWTAEAALAAVGGGGAAAPAPTAEAELAAGFAEAWPPAAGWGPPARTLTGVRALAPRSSAGRPPLAGRLAPAAGEPDAGNWWAIAGLGSRGLTYSAWCARLVARAAVAAAGVGGGGVGGGGGGGGGGSEDATTLPAELTRWQGVKGVAPTSRPGRRRRRQGGERGGAVEG